MSMNLNLGVRALGAVSYFLLLAFTGGAGANVHDSHTTAAASPVQISAPAQDQAIGEMILSGAPFLLGMALCGSITGILGAALVQKTEQAVRNAQRRSFAAAAATAIPTVAVRLTSSEANDIQLLTFRNHTPAAQPLVHV